MTACLNEILRWRPAVVLGTPRMTLAGGTVLGYYIPKGTQILINMWAIHHNPEDYDEPERFDPGRFLPNRLGTKYDPEEKGDMSSWRKPVYTFGAGRRICQGELVTIEAMHILFAVLL